MTNVAEYVGPASRHIHYGMTSSDVLDTALAYQMKSAGNCYSKIKAIERCFEEKSNRTQRTICVGRSHGIHAAYSMGKVCTVVRRSETKYFTS